MGQARLAIAVSWGMGVALIAHPGSAQTITPDGTLGTVVNQTGSNYTITNGTAAGSNLYHSFRQFSIPTGGSAVFDLNATPAIRTIFSRVTGGNISNIDGLIRTTNSANPVSLFLINPAGIVFGANASLNIGGSFVGTTASSVKFADGTEFSAVNPVETSLLTVSVPIGLQLGSNPGGITVQGSGHRLVTNPTNSAPIAGAGLNPLGLRVPVGNTLALIGGDVTLVGGILSAPQGRLELGAGSEGTVSLNATSGGWRLGWEGVARLGNVQLAGRSLLDASGAAGGNIQLTGRQVTLLGGSIALLQNSDGPAVGTLGVKAAETVNISGFSPDNQASSGLISSSLAGKGAEIAIVTRQLVDTGLIVTQAFNASTGGNLSIRASDSIQLDAAFRAVTSSRNGLAALAYQAGQSGDITVTTDRLNVLNGATITSTTSGTGNAGNVLINAQESIRVIGLNSTLAQQSLIAASSFGAGNGGTITLNTTRLTLEDGTVISTSFKGNSGSITVNATDAIEINGSFQPDPLLQTRITSGVFLLPQQLTRSSALPSGRSGNISLNTERLSLTNGGSVAVSNVGTGNGGTIRIQATSVSLDRQGAITAATTSGEGGNIFLQTQFALLRHNSTITATALGGGGNGGNITIVSPIVAGFENSDIAANAIQGRGGNIQITTQGIFGLKFRPHLTPANDITASSQLGVNGTVQVNTIGVDPSAGLAELPMNPIDPSQQIAAGCAEGQGSEFVVTGRGGIPEDPTQAVRHDRPWADLRDLGAFRSPTPPLPHSPTPLPLTEATTWQRTLDGNIELIAASPSRLPFSALGSCARAD